MLHMEKKLQAREINARQLEDSDMQSANGRWEANR